MTREQTIEKLKALYTNAVAAMLRADACDDDGSAKVMTEYAETLNSAITALTALQTDGDCISRQAAIDAITEYGSGGTIHMSIAELKRRIEHLPSVQPLVIHCTDCEDWYKRQSVWNVAISELPSVQQEPLSDAYMKAVWTWLLNYQIKVAELKGRYTPYEVLSWVANDWRKEHEGLD